MSREAMKLALEAMERYQVKRQDFDRFADEITALQKALANEALDRKAENARELGLDYEPQRWAVFCKDCRKEWSVSYPHPGKSISVKSICVDCDEKLTQREPVGRPASEEDMMVYQAIAANYQKDFTPPAQTSTYTCGVCGVSMQMEQQAQQEPVAKHYVDGGHLVYPKAQRPWVGLTDKELSEVYNQADWDTVNGWEYERAIEAKLKEKNNG